MNSLRLRHVSLDGGERTQIRLALLARIDYLTSGIPDCRDIGSVEELASQAQRCCDAYAALWDDVITREMASRDTVVKERALQNVTEEWLRNHPNALISNPIRP